MEDLLFFLQNEYNYDCKLNLWVDKYPIETIVKEILEWLKTDNLNYFDTTTFARDFYLGSDLSHETKDIFYEELKRQGFFKELNNFLYSTNFSVCSWTIYTIGKFSNYENVGYLETAYETKFIRTNPILAYRCLSELNWLISEKTEQYLTILETENSTISKLILLYYWEIRSYSPKFKQLLADKELSGFILPYRSFADKEDEISDRLLDFEKYISKIYEQTKDNSINLDKFERLAEDYFKEYAKRFDEDSEKQHQDFINKFGKN